MKVRAPYSVKKTGTDQPGCDGQRGHTGERKEGLPLPFDEGIPPVTVVRTKGTDDERWRLLWSGP